MKEITIIIISLILVFVGSYVSQSYIESSTYDLQQEIDSLKNEIESAKIGRENKSKELAESIYEKWEQTEEKWSIVVMHSELDAIKLALTGMKTYVEEEQYTEGLEELEKAEFLIGHIKEKEKVVLKNIL